MLRKEASTAGVLYFYEDVGHFDNPINNYPENSG
jgi:hypothetical protein